MCVCVCVCVVQLSNCVFRLQEQAYTNPPLESDATVQKSTRSQAQVKGSQMEVGNQLEMETATEVAELQQEVQQ